MRSRRRIAPGDLVTCGKERHYTVLTAHSETADFYQAMWYFLVYPTFAGPYKVSRET
jgi:hypothetical protein